MTSTQVTTVLGICVILLATSACGSPPQGRRQASRHDAGETGLLTADQIALGARLFEDVSLSRDSSLSCATCHSPYHAFAEPREVSHGLGARARKRNSPSLINVALHRRLFDWDGRAASLEDQLRGVFSLEGDMGIDLGEVVARVRSSSSYDRGFWRAYGRRADVAAVLAALAAFQGSLVFAESRFDRFYLGGDSTALSEREKIGWALFRSVKSGCAGCHSPAPDPESGIILFTDLGFHNLGVGYEDGRMEDIGRYAVTREPSRWGAFKTPSLRNVAMTAPYMHDGSLPTLDSVVAFYASGGNRNPAIDVVMARRGLTRQERADIVAFLRSLTAEWLTDSSAVGERLLRAASR